MINYLSFFSTRKFALISLLLLSYQAVNAQSEHADARKNAIPENSIHRKALLIDTHNDIPSTAIEKNYSFDQSLAYKTHSDLGRMLSGGVDAQFFSIWCDGKQPSPYQWANREIDTVIAWTVRNPRDMQLATTVKQIRKAQRTHKLAALLGVEGGHMIENDLQKLETLYHKGVRYMTLTWNNSTDWATSAADETLKGDSLGHKGLSEFGKSVVRKMNELGMMVDLSHTGEQTFRDAITVTTKPVLVSHSCVAAICPHRRNLKDEQIKAVAKNGGVICINFYSGFLQPGHEERMEAFLSKHKAETDSIRKVNPSADFMHSWLFAKYPEESRDLVPPLSILIDHIDYIVKLVGADYVGLGSDFDGVGSVPQGLSGVESFPRITEALEARGYRKKEIVKILGGNVLRVMKANQKKN